MKQLFIIAISLIILLSAGVFVFLRKSGPLADMSERSLQLRAQIAPIEPFVQAEEPSLNANDFTDNESISSKILAEPIADFYNRITKKPFGIYITPETSPIPHDRFSGYHTGVDIEYSDILEDVPVLAVEDGDVILSRFIPGYGGVVVIRQSMGIEKLLVLYGHLDPKALPIQNSHIERGQRVGFLGEGETEETDGVRKHLHFAILKGDILNLRGYVDSQEELLLGWYNPMDFYTK